MNAVSLCGLIPVEGCLCSESIKAVLHRSKRNDDSASLVAIPTLFSGCLCLNAPWKLVQDILDSEKQLIFCFVHVICKTCHPQGWFRLSLQGGLPATARSGNSTVQVRNLAREQVQLPVALREPVGLQFLLVGMLLLQK